MFLRIRPQYKFGSKTIKWKQDSTEGWIFKKQYQQIYEVFKKKVCTFNLIKDNL